MSFRDSGFVFREFSGYNNNFERMSKEEERKFSVTIHWLKRRIKKLEEKLDVNEDEIFRNELDCTRTMFVEVRNELINYNYNLVFSSVSKYLRKFPALSIEEVFSEGFVTLLNCAEGFRYGLGTFANYFKESIWKNVGKLADKMYIKKRKMRLYLMKDVGDFYVEENREDEETDKIKIRETLNKAIIKIPDKRLEVIIDLRYGLLDGIKYTQEEVSRVFGLSKERIGQLESKAKDILSRNQDLRELYEVYHDN
jgi:RNA polymerase sigma factor (sigma-70 family)